MAYEIKITPDKGRAMFATRNIQSGDVIFLEKPLASSQFSWNKTYKNLCCENCLRPLETAEMNIRRLAGDPTINLPFPECCTTMKRIERIVSCPHCQVKYCCDDCRVEAAQKYHFALCQKDAIHPLIESWKKVHCPPETTTIELIAKLLGVYIQADEKNHFMNYLEDFQRRNVDEDLMTLLGPNFESQLSELYPHYYRAFGVNGDLKEFLTTRAFKTFFAIIATNGQGISTSPFTEWVKNVCDLKLSDDERKVVESLIEDLWMTVDDVTGLQFMNNDGCALYVTQSKINHSSVPNSVITFPTSDHVLAITALSDIKAGDEITISYLNRASVDRSRCSTLKVKGCGARKVNDLEGMRLVSNPPVQFVNNLLKEEVERGNFLDDRFCGDSPTHTFGLEIKFWLACLGELEKTKPQNVIISTNFWGSYFGVDSKKIRRVDKYVKDHLRITSGQFLKKITSMLMEVPSTYNDRWAILLIATQVRIIPTDVLSNDKHAACFIARKQENRIKYYYYESDPFHPYRPVQFVAKMTKMRHTKELHIIFPKANERTNCCLVDAITFAMNVAMKRVNLDISLPVYNLNKFGPQNLLMSDDDPTTNASTVRRATARIKEPQNRLQPQRAKWQRLNPTDRLRAVDTVETTSSTRKKDTQSQATGIKKSKPKKNGNGIETKNKKEAS